MADDLLPAVPAAEVDEVEGVIVSEPAPKVYDLRTVAQHPAPRAAGRHAVYVAVGAAALVRRRREGRTLAERMAKDLHAQGEHDKAALLIRHMADERQRRHERTRARAQLLIELARNAHWLIAAAVLCMLVFGIVLGDPAWPFHAAHTAAVDFRAVVTWGARIGVIAVPLAVLTVLHETGRRSGLAPQWARTAADADVDAAIDELTITTALANLRIPQVRDYLKMGVPLQFVTSCRQEGRGTYAEIRLPNGLPAAELAKAARRERLAAGLYRHTKEVWPTTGDDNSVLKLWIADKGALDEGAGPYPLLTEGFTDVFKGLPFGRSLRGDPVKIPVIGRNSIVGGAPEQGKSNSARVVACGYTLDLIAELRIYVPDANFDFDAFAPRCSRYLVGAEDEVIEQMLEEQELLKEELQARGQLLRDFEVQEVTYEIAHAGVGLHPVFNLVEEAHVAITHKKYGKDFGQLLGENVKLCRKRGEHIEVSTQAPVRGAMPRDVTTNCTVGIAHALSDTYANDALLGPGAARSGHRAMDLMIGADRGIALCKGFASEARSEMVQVYKVTAGQVPQIVARTMKAMAEQGLAVPGTERGPLAIVSRDLLADLATVLAHRSDRVRVADLPPMLRNLAKSWGPYRALTGKELLGLLTAEGVRTTNTANVRELDPAELHRVIAEREDGVS